MRQDRERDVHEVSQGKGCVVRRVVCENCSVRHGGFCDLPTAVFEELKSITSRIVYRPRQVVFSEGMPCTGLYLVCHGNLKLYNSDRFAHDHIVDLVGPGSMVGEFTSEGESRHSVSAEALNEVQLAYLPRERLSHFLKAHPGSALRLIELLSLELANARRKVRDLALKKAESRMAALLIELSANGGAPRLRWRRRDLAEMIGVSTETAIRLLAKLKRRGAIRPEGREVVVCDVPLLTRLAHHDSLDA